MRILHIIASVNPKDGGPIEGILQQAAHRSSNQHSVHIASLDPPDAKFVSECPITTFALGKTHRAVGTRKRWQLWRRYGYQPGALAWLRQNQTYYDVVIINGLWNYSTMIARRALVGSSIPYVVFSHGMMDPWFKKAYPIKHFLKQFFWLFNEGRLLKNASAVLFTTDEERRVSRGSFWPYKLREKVVGYGTSDVVGDPADQEAAFRAALPQLGDRRYLLFLSRIHPKKGVDLLVDAFSEIAQQVSDLDLVIAGPDQVSWKTALETQARRQGVEARIHWLGMVKGDIKWGAYHGCEAFVLPSHQENFGIVVAEALAAGKPVLISNKVQIWREIEAGRAGIVEPDDLQGTSRLLKRFLKLSPAARCEMGLAAREIFLSKFHIAKTVANVDAVLMEAIEAKSSYLQRKPSPTSLSCEARSPVS